MSELGGAYFLPRSAFADFFATLGSDGREVIGPTVHEGTITLRPIGEASDLPVGWSLDNAPGKSRLVRRGDGRAFDFAVPQASWRRWTKPPRATQSAWTVDEEGRVVRLRPDSSAETAPRAFLGVRACEIAALRIHDRVYTGSDLAERAKPASVANTLVVGVECAIAGGTCFCTSQGTGPELTDGYDLALAELDDGFVVRVGTDAGAALVDGLALAPAQAEAVAAAAGSVKRVREQMGEPLPMAGVPERLVAAAESPRWAEIAQRCLACANCTLVCPTCFCYSVGQRSDLDGSEATTEVRWDSCFTLDFAKVAGGNFRSRLQDRYRQWLTHKFGTWWGQFGTSGCVGCGRCITWCPVGIDVRAEVMAIAGPTAPVFPTRAVPTSTPGPIATQVDQAPAPAPTATTILVPPTPTAVRFEWIPTKVVATRRETADVVTLRLATDDAQLLAGRPGQFVMAALPAVSAPPISVSRYLPDGLELTIRAAGPATAAITRLERGALLSLRGPLGRGWPVELADGRDVQIVTGGIGLAPLRSLLDALIARRNRIGVIHLAYGARTPADRIFREELDELAASDDIEIAQTVDRAGPEWLGRVGVVTQVIDRVMCACDRTVAFVCGPERMMAATADVLRERGVPAERIFFTLERRMECGVGQCGHCQLGRYFVCRDGPVLSLAELGPALGQEGL